MSESALLILFESPPQDLPNDRPSLASRRRSGFAALCICPYGTDCALTAEPLTSYIKAAEISLLSRFPEATQQGGKLRLDSRLSLRALEVGCKSRWGRRSSVFIIGGAIILHVIISCALSSSGRNWAPIQARKWRRAGLVWLVALSSCGIPPLFPSPARSLDPSGWTQNHLR